VDHEKLHFFSTRGEKRYDYGVYSPGDYLVFGPESRGIDPRLLKTFRERIYHIPMDNLHVRSLNLSSSVAVVLFEALRHNDFSIQ